MCGITGIIAPSLNEEQQTGIVRRMNGRLSHRGPDNQDLRKIDNGCIGHCRLSIIDLSPESNQPFTSADQRFTIVYNGELYNYRELKLELQRTKSGSTDLAYFFTTASDTEVLLAAYIRWGIKCLDHLNGMFAFAIYDYHEKKLFVARDRYGVKPLYYYHADNKLVFASELRAILGSGVKQFSINRAKIPEYLMYQTIYAPFTIVAEIQMLMPGHYMEFRDGHLQFTQYYKPAIRAQDPLSYEHTCRKVFELLAAAVNRRMIADVPFGAFLSGGIDSSAVVALMSLNNSKVKTFNISFDESEFSEAHFAALIAKKFNTDHHEIRLTPDHFLKTLPEALNAMDHPSGDGPNTYIVSKASRNAGITMALSGIGGDELFAGYDVFTRLHALGKKSWLNAVPPPIRQLSGRLIALKGTVRAGKMADLLSLPNIEFQSAYQLNRSLFPKRFANKVTDVETAFGQIAKIVSDVPRVKDHFLSAVSVAEMNTYLQNVLLRDTDQMSMAVALEVREPFLDHALVEFVLGVSDAYKFPHSPKKLLVDSMGDLLPAEIVNRPKMGFTLPWAAWLKKDLRTFSEANINQLETKALFKPGSVTGLWKAFLQGNTQVTWGRVWHLIVLNDWIEKNTVSLE
jgi:asparagine synthase (glutamine-hydrolysing)